MPSDYTGAKPTRVSLVVVQQAGPYGLGYPGYRNVSLHKFVTKSSEIHEHSIPFFFSSEHFCKGVQGL